MAVVGLGLGCRSHHDGESDDECSDDEEGGEGVMSDADDEDLSQKSNSRLKAILVCGAVAEWSSFASWRDC